MRSVFLSAPSAVRSASSFSRRVSRASVRLATLAQATSSTNAAAPSRTKSVGRARLASWVRSGVTDTAKPCAWS